MKVEVSIPSTLDDITLEQYQRYLLIEEPTNEDLLEIFLNFKREAIKNIKLSEVTRMVGHLVELFNKEQELKLKFVLNGVRMGFIPSLDDITYGENKDVTNYVNDWQTMHKAMAVLYRPITQNKGDKYLIEEYNGTRKYSEMMKQMPLSVAMGALVFFYNLTNELLKHIPSYLQKELKKEQVKNLITQENGEAITKLTHSLKETLDDLTRLQSFPYINVSLN